MIRPSKKIFVSRNAIFLEKGFPSDNRRDEVLIEESSEEPRHDNTTSFEPPVHTDGVPVLRRSTRESRVREMYGFMGLTSQLDNDPKTYGEAMSDINSEKWLEAMKFEMDSMGSNQVWTLVDPPKGVRPVGCKWVNKRKLGADGEITVFKARLVAKGYTQRPGVDFEETYSPVALAKSIRILLAIAACRKVSLLLERTRKSVISKVIGNDVKMLGDIKVWLSTQFSMMDMGEASYILGIKIYRDRSRKMLGLSQSLYIEKVLKRLKMEHSKRGLLPMRHGVNLSKKQSPKTDEELKRMSNIPYASAIGSIQYAVQCTRPDVAYTLSVTSRYQTCAGVANWGAVNSILKYLKRNKDMFLIYGGGELILEGYSDASFQSDDDDIKFQSGFVFKLNGGVVNWKSSMQDADSTTEDEYIAASEAAKEAVWMKNYIQELGVVHSIADPVVIFCDNNGAIAQANESRSHHHSKHILRCYHLLREMASRGDCRMDRVSSVENTADSLTKSILLIAHTQHLDKMGLRSMGDWL
ncbi:UNVERIFIED_CONTAM: Retrovirus-related Pol polyprotein from transposon TNT 1-94 [Sesamum latifolium]|uniref:Retrovirus-related Pol polyprotein from transposon TNT 1-94 n=1 Tax=Sesamum latifolium TaxID=2727402 RepID=A0AAW2XND5_9LAMI